MASSIYDCENYLTLTESDNERWDIYDAAFKNLRYLVPASKTIVLTSADSANLPGIAATYLGSRFLWWALLAYNGLYDAIEDVGPGVTLNIPDPAALITFLKANNQQRTQPPRVLL